MLKSVGLEFFFIWGIHIKLSTHVPNKTELHLTAQGWGLLSYMFTLLKVCWKFGVPNRNLN